MKQQITRAIKQEITKSGNRVSFTEDFLGKLIDAVALLDLAEMVMKGNQEVGLSPLNMTGIIILLEEIKERLDIEAHLLEE
jgi:hypothetical protein